MLYNNGSIFATVTAAEWRLSKKAEHRYCFCIYGSIAEVGAKL
jgi:hypothetical protein